jgi:hypothetical protein
MNRLRAAYVELDPGIERYLVTSAHDDDNGIWQTYNHLRASAKCRNVWFMLVMPRGSGSGEARCSHFSSAPQGLRVLLICLMMR